MDRSIGLSTPLWGDPKEKRGALERKSTMTLLQDKLRRAFLLERRLHRVER